MSAVILPPGGLSKTFERMLKNSGNLKQVYKTIGEIQVASVQKTFKVGGRPKWKPSSRSISDGGTALSDTGRLKNSINYRLVADGVIVGTNVRYATTMHFGAKRGAFGSKTVTVKAHTRKSKLGKKYSVKSFGRKMVIPWGNIPARPFLVIRDEDIIKFRQAVYNAILKGK